jgi:crotonobetainyl-CoA:carnitine CoA-transferase CaiB-like acyl-CoA transferase
VKRLLDDVRVVDLSHNSVAGSYCGKLFADVGATVIKVEAPGGDPLRRVLGLPDREDTGGQRPANSGLFLHLNTNKWCETVDPEDVTSRDRLLMLVGDSDLVICAGQGQLDDWHLTWREIHEAFPTLNVLALTAFGLDGPYGRFKGSDLIFQAFAGAMQFQDRTDHDPVKLAGDATSCLIGNIAAVGALAAVEESRQTGRGSLVDCSAVEALSSTPLAATRLLAGGYESGRRVSVRSPTDGATVVPLGAFPCADGYVAVVTMVQQLKKLTRLLGDPHLSEILDDPSSLAKAETRQEIDAVFYPWLLSQTRAEVTTAAQEIGFPLTPILNPEDVLDAEHLHQRGVWTRVIDPEWGQLDLPGPPYRHGEGGWALRRLPGSSPDPPMPQPARAGSHGQRQGLEPAALVAPVGNQSRPPLEGIRVVDMTAVFAGPYLTMLLADLGAEVIRVENPWVFPPSTKGFEPRPTLPDDTRGELASGYGPLSPGRPDRPYNRHSMNNVISRNKLSCTIDVRRAEGRELLMKLVEKSDVFVESFKASSLGTMQLYPEEMLTRNPGLVIARVPPTGLSGEWAHWTGFGMQFDAITGLLALTGHRDTSLMDSPPTLYMDNATGPAGAFAVLAALHYRKVTGRGQIVEIAQTDNLLQHIGDHYVDLQRGIAARRMGNRDRWLAPQGLYRCQDERWLAISVSDDSEWHSLAGVVEAGLAADERFSTVPLRHEHHDELDKVLADWAAGVTAYEGFYRLQDAGVAAGPLLDPASFCGDPQITARSWMRPLTTTDVGTHPHPGHPYRGVTEVWRRGSPALGEDNEYVYKSLLGVSDSDFERLRGLKILGEDYLDSAGKPY